MTYVKWAALWHVVKDQGETFCGRFVMPGALRHDRNPGVEFLCSICRAYL